MGTAACTYTPHVSTVEGFEMLLTDAETRLYKETDSDNDELLDVDHAGFKNMKGALDVA